MPIDALARGPDPGHFARAVAGHPWQVLLLLALVTAAAVQVLVDFEHGRLNLDIDASPDPLVDQQSEPWLLWKAVRKQFGGDGRLIVAMRFDDVFSRENLSTLDRVTHRLRAVKGVVQVDSLTNTALRDVPESDA